MLGLASNITTVEVQIIAAVIGLAGVLLVWKGMCESTARDLLVQALAIQALKEAWLLENPTTPTGPLSLPHHLNLAETPSETGPWLRRVEVRAALDEAQWNAPKNPFYDFKDGRRTWIVRDVVLNAPDVYRGQLAGGQRPALVSSMGLEELCAWVERVASAYRGKLLTKRGIKMLYPLLDAVTTQDRVNVLGRRLSKEAKKFLPEQDTFLKQIRQSQE